MKIKIDKKLKETSYMQLYKGLVSSITKGVYPYGSRLPSKRVIADETGLSLITVEHAIELLCDEGYVQARQRSGIFVTYREKDFLAGYESTMLPVPDIPEQTHNVGDFPFSLLARTMRRVLLDYNERILEKSPNHGCQELRNEICLYLARSRGAQIKPSQVIIGAGSEYLYGLVVQLLGTDKIYGLESPSYNKIRKVYESMGASCDMLSMTSEGIDSKELERTRAEVLHVTPLNSFPSGVTAGISKRREYLSWAGEREAVIIEDNYDFELFLPGGAFETIYSMSPDSGVISLNTFSKAVAPSMRIGYMILPRDMIELFNTKLGFYSCTVPAFDQYVLAELIKNGDLERHINRLRRRRRV